MAQRKHKRKYSYVEVIFGYVLNIGSFVTFFMVKRLKFSSKFKPKPQALCNEPGIRMNKIPFTHFFLETHPKIKGFALHRILLAGGMVQGDRVFMRVRDYPKKSKS